jgi:hypothetical protein
MKKIIAMLLVLVLAMSMCACSDDYAYTNDAGEEVKAESGEVVFETSGDFTITKVDKSIYYTSSWGSKNEYTVVIKNSECAAIVLVTAEEYALWEVGDVISGTLVATYYSGYTNPIAKFHCCERKFSVDWYSEIK